MENASYQSKNETSAMEKFFLSMCDTTCQLPEYLQMRIQRQIFNIVMEAKEQHLMRSNYSDNSPGCSVYNSPVVLLSNYKTGIYLLYDQFPHNHLTPHQHLKCTISLTQCKVKIQIRQNNL
ncbi:unnamed protein product [Pieris macdunnoughi]|uniref:BESS domain-containing protein n=1 Tax=Pieris macdunnoughi TaxID=345717 RepID=A0A821XTK2_9NEOP|nr:unnamed protein product [Pieris macdunnoughi]